MAFPYLRINRIVLLQGKQLIGSFRRDIVSIEVFGGNIQLVVAVFFYFIGNIGLQYHRNIAYRHGIRSCLRFSIHIRYGGLYAERIGRAQKRIAGIGLLRSKRYFKGAVIICLRHSFGKVIGRTSPISPPQLLAGNAIRHLGTLQFYSRKVLRSTFQRHLFIELIRLIDFIERNFKGRTFILFDSERNDPMFRFDKERAR